MEDEQLERLKTASDLLATARLAGISYLESRKRAREAMLLAREAGCSDASIAQALGVTKVRVRQILEQEAMKPRMSDEDYDNLVMSFPPAGLTSLEYAERAAREVHDAAKSKYQGR